MLPSSSYTCRKTKESIGKITVFWKRIKMTPKEGDKNKLADNSAKAPQIDRNAFPKWPQSRPLVRPYNVIKSSKYICKMYKTSLRKLIF